MTRFVQQALLVALSASLISFLVFDRETAIRHLAIGLLVPLVLLGLSMLQRRQAADDGREWRRLTASHLHMFGFVLSAGLTGLFAYVYFFVGSSRADAATQMKVLLGLLVAFGIGTVAMLVTCFLVKVRWNRDGIERWIGPWRTSTISWNELAGAERSIPSGSIRLLGADGSHLAFDPSCDGAEELLEEVVACLPALALPASQP